MRYARVFVVVLACLAGADAQPCGAQEVPGFYPSPPSDAPTAPTAGDPAVDLKLKLMYWQGGFSPSLLQNGERVELGLFGGNAHLYFSESPEALASAQSSRALMIPGFTLYTIGMACLLADLTWTTYGIKSSPSVGDHLGAYLGILGVGAGASITGIILVVAGRSALMRAVNQYNGHLINQLLPPGQRIDLQIFASVGGGGLGVRGSF